MNAHEVEEMAEFHRHELDVGVTAFEEFADEVAGQLKVDDLDGDQAVDGFSIDTAFSFFEDGLTVAEAVEEFECLIEDVTPRLVPMADHIGDF